MPTFRNQQAGMVAQQANPQAKDPMQNRNLTGMPNPPKPALGGMRQPPQSAFGQQNPTRQISGFNPPKKPMQPQNPFAGYSGYFPRGAQPPQNPFAPGQRGHIAPGYPGGPPQNPFAGYRGHFGPNAGPPQNPFLSRIPQTDNLDAYGRPRGGVFNNPLARGNPIGRPGGPMPQPGVGQRNPLAAGGMPASPLPGQQPAGSMGGDPMGWGAPSSPISPLNKAASQVRQNMAQSDGPAQPVSGPMPGAGAGK